MLVKNWILCSCKFKVNLLIFLVFFYYLLFDLETIGISYIIIWWLIFWKKTNQFWQEIWIQILIILLQLYDPISGLVKEPIGDTEKRDHRVKLFADSWYKNNGDEVFAIRYGWKHTEQLTSVYTIAIQIYLIMNLDYFFDKKFKANSTFFLPGTATIVSLWDQL